MGAQVVRLVKYSTSMTAARFKGNKPHASNPDMMLDEVMASSQAFLNNRHTFASEITTPG